MPVIKRDVFEEQRLLSDEDAFADESGDFSYDDETDAVSSGQLDYFERIGDTLERLIASDGPLEPLVVELVRNSLFRILGQLDRAELIENAVSKAFGDLELSFAMSLHVSPADHEVAQRKMEQLQRSIPVHSDPLLFPGEIVVETPKGRFHIGAREQALALTEALERDWQDE
jgi:type III secretion protein L